MPHLGSQGGGLIVVAVITMCNVHDSVRNNFKYFFLKLHCFRCAISNLVVLMQQQTKQMVLDECWVLMRAEPGCGTNGATNRILRSQTNGRLHREPVLPAVRANNQCFLSVSGVF